MYINTTGLVLRCVDYKENSKILTILTAQEGKLTVSAHGANRKNSKLSAVTEQFVYSEMTLLSKGGRWTLTEAQCIEQFVGLRDDLEILAVASYIMDVAEVLSDEDRQNPELLSLCLNSLYALAEKIRPPKFVKPVFELRAMSISGFRPVIVKEPGKPGRVVQKTKKRCSTVQEDGEQSRVVNGAEKCYSFDEIEGKLFLCGVAFDVARYILEAQSKKLFSFKATDEVIENISPIAEQYLLTHLDRTFKTLDYLKSCI